MADGVSGGGSIEDSMKSMQDAARQNAALMACSTQVSSQIQAASSAAHAIEGANAAGGEVAKAAANDLRQAAKSN